MTVVRDRSGDEPNGLAPSWSAGELLSSNEVFQNRGGADIAVATGNNKPTDVSDGILLKPGDSVLVASGLTVYWLKVAAQGGSLSGIMSRTVVS